eukprot:s38_g6.t3
MGEQIRPNASSHLQAEATAADERQVKKERAAREKALAKQVSHGLGLDLINRECRGLQQLRMLNLDDGHQHRWEGKASTALAAFIGAWNSLASSSCVDSRQATYTASVFQTFESKAHAAANFHKLDGYKYDRDPGCGLIDGIALWERPRNRSAKGTIKYVQHLALRWLLAGLDLRPTRATCAVWLPVPETLAEVAVAVGRSPRPKDGTVIVWDVTSGAATRELSYGSAVADVDYAEAIKVPLCSTWTGRGSIL